MSRQKLIMAEVERELASHAMEKVLSGDLMVATTLAEILQLVAPIAYEKIGKYIEGHKIRKEDEYNLIVNFMLFEEIHRLRSEIAEIKDGQADVIAKVGQLKKRLPD